MNDNYSPPKVRVGDPPVQSSRPSAIRRALVLMSTSVAFHFVVAAADWRYLVIENSYRGVSLMALAIYSAVCLFLVFMVAAAHNWARIVYALLFFAPVLGSLPELSSMAERSPWAAGAQLIQFGLGIGATYLLFGPGRGWFQR